MRSRTLVLLGLAGALVVWLLTRPAPTTPTPEQVLRGASWK